MEFVTIPLVQPAISNEPTASAQIEGRKVLPSNLEGISSTSLSADVRGLHGFIAGIETITAASFAVSECGFLVYVSDEAVSLLLSALRKRANNNEAEMGEETENLPTYCIALLTLNPGLRRLVARGFGIFT